MIKNKNFNGQIHQDRFVCEILQDKKNDFFLEIGSNDPVWINNTCILEKDLGWNGIMIESNPIFLEEYKKQRPNSHYVIEDATQIDYLKLLKSLNFPKNLGYLSFDLEAGNGSTIKTLEKLNTEIFNEYKFAVVTFEHDIYLGNFHNTQARSREIFLERGYELVFQNVANTPPENPFEDWYVHPELIENMEFVNKIKLDKQIVWTNLFKRIDFVR